MCRRPFAASDLHHSLKSKYCKKIFNFVTVSKFSFLFNKIRIHNGSFNIKTAFLAFTVFLEKRQMCRRPFAASDFDHSLKSKYCKEIFNFVTVSKFSFLFNKIRIHNGSFNIKTAFLPLTVFQEKRQMCRRPFAASDFDHSLKSKYCKKIFNFVTVSKFSFLFNKIRIHNGSFNIKTAFLPFTVFLEKRQMCRRPFAASDFDHSLKSKYCKKIFNFVIVSKFSFLFNKIRIHNGSFTFKTAFLPFTVFLEKRQMCRRPFAASDLHHSLKSKYCKKIFNFVTVSKFSFLFNKIRIHNGSFNIKTAFLAFTVFLEKRQMCRRPFAASDLHHSLKSKYCKKIFNFVTVSKFSFLFNKIRIHNGSFNIKTAFLPFTVFLEKRQMCRRPFAASDFDHSLKSKYCKKIFNFVIVSKFSFLFNKIRIHNGSFNIKTAFLPLTVFQEKRQMCRRPFAASDFDHSLKSKYCKKIFNFVTVSKFSFLFNKIRIHNGSFNIKTAFLPLTVFQEKRQMCRRPFAASDFDHSLKSKYCKKIFNFVTVSKFSFLFNKIRIHNGSFNIKTAFLPLTVSQEKRQMCTP